MKKKPAKRCRHHWVWKSHNDFRDGEYSECPKCGKISFEHKHKLMAYKSLSH